MRGDHRSPTRSALDAGPRTRVAVVVNGALAVGSVLAVLFGLVALGGGESGPASETSAVVLVGVGVACAIGCVVTHFWFPHVTWTRTSRVHTGIVLVGLAAVVAVVGTFLPWYHLALRGAGESGWSLMRDHGIRMDQYPIQNGVTGAVTLLAAVALIVVACVARWLVVHHPESRGWRTVTVRLVAAALGVAACILLIMPSAALNADERLTFRAVGTRVLIIDALVALFLALPLALLPLRAEDTFWDQP
jgi:hypothetical protein